MGASREPPRGILQHQGQTNLPLPPQQYQTNPQHVQQQFIVMPGQPSQAQLTFPPGQGLPINPNNIALPTPNYAYSRIGPNNQGLLSPTTLQNKLRVI